MAKKRKRKREEYFPNRTCVCGKKGIYGYTHDGRPWCRCARCHRAWADRVMEFINKKKAEEAKVA